TVLGGRVRRTGPTAEEAADGGDVDDDSPALVLELLDHPPHGIRGSAEIEDHDLLERLVVELAHGAVVVHDPGVVDEHVDPTEPLDSLVDHKHDVLFVGHITHERHDLPPGASGILHELVQPLATHRDRKHAGAFAREHVADGPPQLRTGPGHH